MRMLWGAIAVAAIAGSTYAADTVVFSDTGDGTTNGGSFKANTGNYPDFETFCIETNEYVTMGRTYYYEISDEAKQGGSGGPDPDPISESTREIYLAFRNGYAASLLGLDLNIQADRNALADAVQLAIWYLEQESGGSNAGNAGTLITWANGTTYAGSDKVRVMNVWENPNMTGNAQDMLIIVPLPSATGLACAGLLGLGAVRRRKA